jgi:hypothetical protein
MVKINHKDAFCECHLTLQSYAGAPRTTRRIDIRHVNTDINEIRAIADEAGRGGGIEGHILHIAACWIGALLQVNIWL